MSDTVFKEPIPKPEPLKPLTHLTKPTGWFGKHKVLCPEPNPEVQVTADAFADHSTKFDPVCVRCVNILMTGNIMRRQVGHEMSVSLIRNKLEEVYRAGVSPEEYFKRVFTGTFVEALEVKAAAGDQAAQELQYQMLLKQDPLLAEIIKKSRGEKSP